MESPPIMFPRPGIFAKVDEVFFFVDWAGLEIAAFVEDIVGGEKRFEMPADDLAFAQKGDGVMEGAADRVGVFLGIADDGVDAMDVLGD